MTLSLRFLLPLLLAGLCLPVLAVDKSQLIKVDAKNKNRCIEFYVIDKTTYCSTKALNKAPAPKQAATKNSWSIQFDGRPWQVGWEHPQGTSIEFVVDGETVNNWTELITAQFYPNRQATATGFRDLMQSSLLAKGYKPKFTTHAQTDTDVLFEFQINAPQAEAQDELQRIISTPKGLYVLHYVIRRADMGVNQRSKWIGLLKASTPK